MTDLLLQIPTSEGGANVATVNSLRQALVDHSECYAFADVLDIKRYGHAYNNIFKLDVSGTPSYCVRQSTCAPIQFLSHRISRVPVFWGRETTSLLEKDVHLFICGERPQDPYINEDSQMQVIYAHDLKGWVIESNESLTPLKREQIRSLFPYNTVIAHVRKGEILHAVLTPTRGMGYMNGKFRPCNWVYRFVSDKEIDMRKSISQQYAVDIFGNPRAIELLIHFNGKRYPVDALNLAINNLIDILERFNTHYQREYEDYIGVDRADPVLGLSEMELISIPRDELVIVDVEHVKTAPEYEGFSTHMLGNLISSRLLQKVIGIIRSYQEEDEAHAKEVQINMIKHTLIAYKEPHPIRKQIVIAYQLPLSSPEFLKLLDLVEEQDPHKMLMNETVLDIIEDLKKIQKDYGSNSVAQKVPSAPVFQPDLPPPYSP